MSHLGTRIWRRPGTVLAVAVLAVATAALPAAAAPSAGSASTPTTTGGAVAAGTASAPVAPAGPVAPVANCAALATVDLSGLDTSIGSAADVTLKDHRFCDVKGYISPNTQFEVLLPQTTWRGDYLQEGCGGFCGHVDVSLDDPSRTSGYQAPFPPLQNGELVVAADDQGHESASNADTLWAKYDPQLRVVFGYSSEHSLALTAKALIRAFYGRGPARSYFDGVSDGGHEALDLAQRYPTDFDGILAGAPANNWAPLVGMFEPWLAVVNMDAAGHQILTAEKLPALHAAVMAACADARGVIADPRACTFDPVSIQCPPGVDNAGCLTTAQVPVVRQFYRGPSDPQGRNLFDGGEPYGSELAWALWAVMPAADPNAPGDTIAAQLGLNYWRYAAFWNNPPAGFGLRDISFTDATYQRLAELGGIYNATDPDLHAFRAHGGKLILYHGWADQAIPPFATVDYYRAVAEQLGGYPATQSFSRLYLIPGLYHCPCGQPADGDPPTTVELMTPLVNWVEHGQAPGTLTLPVTAGRITSLPVPPTNPLNPPPRNNGLNSNYRYIGATSAYRPGNELWCTQRGTQLVCTHHRP
jgi:Tannase and feruloyl esterase